MDSNLIQWTIGNYAYAICDVNDASTFAYGGLEFHLIICKLLKK